MPPRPSLRWISYRPIWDPGSNINRLLPGGRRRHSTPIYLSRCGEAHTIRLAFPERHYPRKFFRRMQGGANGVSASTPRRSPAALPMRRLPIRDNDAWRRSEQTEKDVNTGWARDRPITKIVRDADAD